MRITFGNWQNCCNSKSWSSIGNYIRTRRFPEDRPRPSHPPRQPLIRRFPPLLGYRRHHRTAPRTLLRPPLFPRIHAGGSEPVRGVAHLIPLRPLHDVSAHKHPPYRAMASGRRMVLSVRPSHSELLRRRNRMTHATQYVFSAKAQEPHYRNVALCCRFAYFVRIADVQRMIPAVGPALHSSAEARPLQGARQFEFGIVYGWPTIQARNQFWTLRRFITYPASHSRPVSRPRNNSALPMKHWRVL